MLLLDHVRLVMLITAVPNPLEKECSITEHVLFLIFSFTIFRLAVTRLGPTHKSRESRVFGVPALDV